MGIIVNINDKESILDSWQKADTNEVFQTSKLMLSTLEC